MSFSQETIEVEDLGSLHSYRTEIPNLIFHMDLDPYVFKAYCVLKKTAGDRGSCFKKTTTLCQEIGVGKTKYVEIKKILVEKKLIRIQKRKHENGASLPDLITIVDIWGMNMKSMMGGFAKRTGGVRHVNGEGSPNEPIEEDPIQQDHKEQQQRAKPPAAVSSSKEKKSKAPSVPKPAKIYACLEGLDKISLSVKLELSKKYPEDQVKDAVEWFIHEKDYRKGPEAALRWACRDSSKYEPPKTPVPTKKYEGLNKEAWKALLGELAKNTGSFSRLNIQQDTNGIQFGHDEKIYFKDKAFLERIQSSIRKRDAFTPEMANFFTMWG